MTTWTVPAVVVAVIDGDTVKLDLDLGWGIWRRGENCRIHGIDAPELSTPEGKEVKAFVQTLLKPGDRVTYVSKELDKYGRPLGTLLFGDGQFNLAGILLQTDRVGEYYGGKRG